MYLMFLIGADSVDSSGWRTKVAYCEIQIPRKGDRYITKWKRHKKYRFNKNWEKKFGSMWMSDLHKRELTDSSQSLEPEHYIILGFIEKRSKKHVNIKER